MTATQKLLLTPSDVAMQLHVSKSTLSKWRMVGAGPQFVKFGKGVFYTPEALVAFIDRRTRTSTLDERVKTEPAAGA